MNVVHLLGRVGKDPERKGESLVTLSVATSKRIKGEDVTQWHSVKAFSHTADFIEKFFHKGDPIAIDGEIEYSKHDDKFYTNIIARQVHFVPKASGETKPAKEVSDDAFDSEIPF